MRAEQAPATAWPVKRCIFWQETLCQPTCTSQTCLQLLQRERECRAAAAAAAATAVAANLARSGRLDRLGCRYKLITATSLLISGPGLPQRRLGGFEGRSQHRGVIAGQRRLQIVHVDG